MQKKNFIGTQMQGQNKKQCIAAGLQKLQEEEEKQVFIYYKRVS